MDFLEEANLPERKVGYVCISEDTGAEIKNNISKLGLKMLLAPSAAGLTSPVRSHADIVIHHMV